MTREQQQINMLENISKILKELPTSNSIRDISRKTNIPETTVRNLLHRSELIAKALGLNNDTEIINEITIKINEWFQKNKYEGSRRGATIASSLRNQHPKISRKR